MGRISVWLFLVFALSGQIGFSAGHVSVSQSHLLVDGIPAPFLFGAEVQYFRARGGARRNVSAAKVGRLWKKLMRRLHEAHMNEVTLYVPWDFHEPREGVFDFDGKLDLDHDGLADYPSRNLRGFLNLLVEEGFRRIMIRPGPYINAEWGPTGFGAVPLWFLQNHPEALAKSRTPGKPLTVTYSHPVFRSRTERWFEALYKQVLKDFIGPGKPVLFLQLDNETNYFWDSVYERDLSPEAIRNYRRFLRESYDGSIDLLNEAYLSDWKSFESIEPPESAEDREHLGKAWHYDWHLFHDREIRDYYRFLRATWENLGVREPDVLFTSCDSFNAPPWGLLPRLDYRQDGGHSLTTMNLYPKTSGTEKESTLNQPMKGAHDAELIAASHRQFYGSAGEWVMSTETMAGWFPPTEVSLSARQHTYGSLLGTGVKAINLYYFHEGWNWDGKEGEDSELHFDTPLDKEMNPRPAFAKLVTLGSALKNGLGDLLTHARPVRASLLIAHETSAQYPLPGLPDALTLSSTDSAALYGFFREAGFRPEIGFIDRMTLEELRQFRAIAWEPPGYSSARTEKLLNTYLAAGGTVITIGKTPLESQGKGKLVALKSSPAREWNSDSYPTLTEAHAELEKARAILSEAVGPARLEIKTEDGKPFVHAWLASTKKGYLLFVENFLRAPRALTVQFAKGLLPASYRITPRWRAEALPGGTMSPHERDEPLSLPVSRDGVDIWEIEPAA